MVRYLIYSIARRVSSKLFTTERFFPFFFFSSGEYILWYPPDSVIQMCAKGQINLFFNGPSRRILPFQMQKKKTFPQFSVYLDEDYCYWYGHTHTQVTLLYVQSILCRAEVVLIRYYSLFFLACCCRPFMFVNVEGVGKSWKGRTTCAGSTHRDTGIFFGAFGHSETRTAAKRRNKKK